MYFTGALIVNPNKTRKATRTQTKKFQIHSWSTFLKSKDSNPVGTDSGIRKYGSGIERNIPFNDIQKIN